MSTLTSSYTSISTTNLMSHTGQTGPNRSKVPRTCESHRSNRSSSHAQMSHHRSKPAQVMHTRQNGWPVAASCTLRYRTNTYNTHTRPWSRARDLLIHQIKGHFVGRHFVTPTGWGVLPDFYPPRKLTHNMRDLECQSTGFLASEIF